MQQFQKTGNYINTRKLKHPKSYTNHNVEKYEMMTTIIKINIGIIFKQTIDCKTAEMLQKR